jgi:hypothetical protein
MWGAEDSCASSFKNSQRGQAATKRITHIKKNFPTDRNNATDGKMQFFGYLAEKSFISVALFLSVGEI